VQSNYLNKLVSGRGRFPTYLPKYEALNPGRILCTFL
jgi:hypothetical protein